MKKMFLVVGMLIAMSISGCTCSHIELGEVGVLVNNMGDDKGVSKDPIGQGYKFIGPTQNLYKYPITLQQAKWIGGESIEFQTSEGTKINVDVSIDYIIEPHRVPDIFSKFKLPAHLITDTFIRNRVKDAMQHVANTMTVEDLYGPGKAKLISEVTSIVK